MACNIKYCICKCVQKDCELYGKCKLKYEDEVCRKIFYPFIHAFLKQEFTKILKDEDAIKIMVVG